MSYISIKVHAVWCTHNHTPLLTNDLHKKLIDHIRINAKSKDIYIDTINGHEDHMHCLFEMNAELSISKTMQLLKGESSYWVNKEKLINNRFAWGIEYYAESVSKNAVHNIREYIKNQEEHHRKMTFEEELIKLGLKPGFDLT